MYINLLISRHALLLLCKYIAKINNIF